jgi:hypothetical protein
MLEPTFAAQPGPDGTVFISYAWADDQPPPHDDKAVGWVTFFWDQLRFELTNRGAKQAQLWLDRYQIDPAEAFTPKIEGAVENASVIVPLFSENWTQSEWCRREVDHFVASRPDAALLVVPVFKGEISLEKLPALIQGEAARDGHRFFARDPRGELHEFYWRGLRDEHRYYKTLLGVATSIKHCLNLKDLEPPPAELGAPPVNATQRFTVFLATATSELRDARQRVRNDLVAAGINVVPETDDLPDRVEAFTAAIDEALASADLAVHFLGEGHGVILEGGSENMIDLQLRCARAGRALPRILWAPRWLPDNKGDARDPVEVAKRFGGPLAGEEVFGKEPTDLSQWIRERLAAPAPEAAAQSDGSIIVASAATVDDPHVAALASLLQGIGPVVEAVFSGDTLSEAPAAACLVPWGDADGATLKGFLETLPVETGRICLILPGGDEAAKSRFFLKGVVAQRLSALPDKRAEAKALLADLELIDAGEAAP